MAEQTQLTRQDFISDQEVRWCPGCGDYSILASMQRLAPVLGIPKENFVFISGIGCSSRFPYYMDTYGFHSIHGRAMTLASGVACTRPDLSVWVVTGDGDALSIGGNHFIHTLRRNLNLNILCFNNRIYGLTKGQYSPTSEVGKKTKSSPYGSIEHPVNALSLALASEATFVARCFDTHTQHLGDTLRRAADHKGVAFVEVYQNCIIFNDKTFDTVTERSVRDERILFLEHGKPMRFGKNKAKGLRWFQGKLEVVEVGKGGITAEDILVHNEQCSNEGLVYLLSKLDYPNYPVPMGVLKAISKPTYDDMIREQISTVMAQRGKGDLAKLLRGTETWEVT